MGEPLAGDRDATDSATENASSIASQPTGSSAPVSEEAAVAQLLAENKRLRAELDRLGPLAEVGLLSAGAAHDLNNLLQLISGSAAQLSPEAEPERDSLRRLNQATDSACDLALQLARWGSIHRSTALTCDLAEAVEQVVDLASPSAPEGVGVRIENAIGLPLACIDPHAAHRIMLNLLLNAWHALRGAGGEVVLRTGSAARERVWVEVEDTGEGMDEQTRDRLFEPFFTTDASGSGLGLAIIRALVDAAGGSIEVWSATGEGSRFRVTLPARAFSESARA